MMERDTYGEVINGPGTYKQIADDLITYDCVLVGWTDQQGTHLDVLFNWGAIVHGNNIQGGISKDDLFVSVMRWGCFGFELKDEDTHPGYIDEKLGNRASFGPTAEPLAELINGVKKALYERHKQAA